jgi:hypothetical protein
MPEPLEGVTLPSTADAAQQMGRIAAQINWQKEPASDDQCDRLAKAVVTAGPFDNEIRGAYLDLTGRPFPKVSAGLFLDTAA